MKIRIHTDDCRMTIPVPLGLVTAAMQCIPSSAFRTMKNSVPEKFTPLVSRKAIRFYCKIGKKIAKEYPGLEIVHVESKEAGIVSICL